MSEGQGRPAVDTATVEAVLPRVRRLAKLLARRRPGADADELFAAGSAAVASAAMRYDPAREVPFANFCWKHALGAMQEALAARLPAASKALQEAQRIGLLAAATLAWSDDPFGGEGEAPVAQVERACDDVTFAYVSGMAHARGESVEELLIAREEDERAIKALRREFDALEDAERQLMRLRYIEGQRLDDVAAALGFSRATAGRRCEALVAKLRKRLEEQGVEAPRELSHLFGAAWGPERDGRVSSRPPGPP